MSDRIAELRIDIEQALLGAILINPEVLNLVSFLKPEHFSERFHGLMYESMTDFANDGKRVTPELLAASGRIEPNFELGGMPLNKVYAKIAASAVTVVSAPDYARQIYDFAQRDTIRQIGEDMSMLARSDSEYSAKTSDILAEAEERLLQVAENVERMKDRKATGPAEVVEEAIQRQTSGDHWRGTRTGLAAFDRLVTGLVPGDLVLMAGRPGMGKTATALSMCRRMATLGSGVAFDSLEMSSEDVWARLLTDEAFTSYDERISYQDLLAGRLNTANSAALSQAKDRLLEMPLSVINRGNGLSEIPSHIRMARRAMERKGAELKVFFVDYLGLVQPSDRYSGRKVDEVGEISITLKALARREQVAIVALHQLSRANESRDNKRPLMSDLRDSGNLEQDADAVLFTYRPAYYLERPGYRNMDEAERTEKLEEIRNHLEIIVAKQRQGGVGTARLWIDVKINSVRDRADQYDSGL
jgi:replicative DNA helicase